MAPSLRPGKSRWRGLGQLSPWLLLVAGLLLVRFSKGAGFADAYALITRPFWPGPAQREWILSARTVEDQSRLQSLRCPVNRHYHHRNFSVIRAKHCF